jgi:HPt (histidine-containing phosphotransfer) domain-containing protein
MFAQSHGEDMQRVQEGLAAGDSQCAQRVAHALKGVAATLGAGRVSDLAESLSSALKQDAPLAQCSELARRCETELMPLAQLILAMPEQDAAPDNTDAAVDPEHKERIL